MLLGIISEAKAVPWRDFSGVWRLQSGQQPQQRRFPRAVQPEDHHPAAPVDGHVDAAEHLGGPVRLGQARSGQRGPAARGGNRETEPGHPVGGALRLHPGQHPLGPALHILRRPGLGRLGPHLVRLCHQRTGLAARVHPLPPAAPLVGLALLQVGAPAQVVGVQAGPLRVEVEDLVHHVAEQRDVVADHHQAAAVALEVIAQPGHRVGVQVVGGLVEEHGLGVGEQDPRQLDAAPLTARQGVQRLVQHPVGQPEAGGDRGRLRLGRVPAEDR